MECILFRVAGVSFDGRQELVKKVARGVTSLRLRPVVTSSRVSLLGAKPH
jgi:hypothetical protein